MGAMRLASGEFKVNIYVKVKVKEDTYGQLRLVADRKIKMWRVLQLFSKKTVKGFRKRP